jgi:hypothetical protein
MGLSVGARLTNLDKLPLDGADPIAADQISH